jgi:transposase
MGKTFRGWNVSQRFLLPPSVQELVPPGHLAHFIRETVCEALDLSAIVGAYVEERGYPPYDPTMMTALLPYAYCQGVYSARRIARACEERVDFMAVTAMQRPDFRTVSDFRKRHLSALGGLFGQVLGLCQQTGMVKLGHVALDGTKMKANASKRKAMSYGRMKKTEPELAAEIAEWFARADEADDAEDREHGDRRGDELPDWVVNKELRRQKLQSAMAELEAQAKAKAAKKSDDDPKPPTGGKPKTKKNAKPKDEPKEQAQLNFTDGDSKIMKTSDGFIQGYNCQIAVDVGAQVIVAHDLVSAQNDAPLLVSMLDQITSNTGQRPEELSADYGYCSTANLRAIRRRKIRGYIATGRQHHGEKSPKRRREESGGLWKKMRQKLKRGGHRSRYRLRKQTVEPVFGHIKEARGFRRFLLRGLKKVPHEWALACTAHNLLKLAQRCA